MKSRGNTVPAGDTSGDFGKQYDGGPVLLSIRAEGAFWCDTAAFPQWEKLPCSAFDSSVTCPDRMLEFRTILKWDGVEPLRLRFSAGCRCRLFLNGTFVEDGPVEVGGDYGKTDAPDWAFYDALTGIFNRFTDLPGRADCFRRRKTTFSSTGNATAAIHIITRRPAAGPAR